MFIEIFHKIVHIKAGSLLPFFWMTLTAFGGHKTEQEEEAPGDNFPHVFLK